jgi:hypothetical protein
VRGERVAADDQGQNVRAAGEASSPTGHRVSDRRIRTNPQPGATISAGRLECVSLQVVEGKGFDLVDHRFLEYLQITTTRTGPDRGKTGHHWSPGTTVTSAAAHPRRGRHVGFVRLRVRLRVGLGVRLRELLLRDGYVELLLAREEDPSRPLGLQQRGAEILGLALDLDARGLAASSKTR